MSDAFPPYVPARPKGSRPKDVLAPSMNAGDGKVFEEAENLLDEANKVIVSKRGPGRPPNVDPFDAFDQIHALLSGLSKSSRDRILATLARIFQG